jgi:hypothetical protein
VSSFFDFRALVSKKVIVSILDSWSSFISFELDYCYRCGYNGATMMILIFGAQAF